MKLMNRTQLMSQGNVSKSLLKLGIPMVISMLVTALYNVVDTYFVNGLGKQAVAAVTVAFPISLVFSGVGLTFGVGAGSFISRLLGKKENKRADEVASTAIISSTAIGLLVAMLALLCLTPMLKFMGAIPSIMTVAKDYAIFFVISCIFSTANVTAGNLAVAQGAANISLTAMISGAVLNMLLDPLFIYGFNMGVQGAAIATLISQTVTSAIYLWFFSSGKSYVKIRLRDFSPSVSMYWEIFKVGVSMLLLQLLSSLSMSRLSAEAGHYGEETIAAMGIVLRIVTLGSNAVFGYMKGFQPMAGFNYSAQNFSRLKQAIKSCMKWTTVFCVVWTLLIFLFASPILSLFSDDPRVLNIAIPALKANVIMFFSFGFQFTYSTLYLAMGKALVGGFLNICRQGIMFIPVILILPSIFGLNGVVYSQVVADLLTTVVTIFFAISIHRKLQNKELEK
ncbi:MATE family efflux transporter [Oscillospiraceae bacterium PP1C4]